jgi:hypothetical protein
MNAPANSNSTAASGPQNHAKHNMLSRRSAIGRLGDSETVRIIGYAHLAAERCSQISVERTPVQPRGVRVLYQPREPRETSWNSRPHRACPSRLLFQTAHQSSYRHNRRVVVVSRRVNTMPSQLNTLVVNRKRLNLCPAQINPYAHLRIYHRTLPYLFKGA